MRSARRLVVDIGDTGVGQLLAEVLRIRTFGAADTQERLELSARIYEYADLGFLGLAHRLETNGISLGNSLIGLVSGCVHRYRPAVDFSRDLERIRGLRALDVCSRL